MKSLIKIYFINFLITSLISLPIWCINEILALNYGALFTGIIALIVSRKYLNQKDLSFKVKCIIFFSNPIFLYMICLVIFLVYINSHTLNLFENGGLVSATIGFKLTLELQNQLG